MENKQKILIIEDEKVLLQAIEKKLQHEGYSTVTAFDGEEGLQRAREEKPDLILLDILMPKLDGFGVLEALKKESLNIPVIIISNSGQAVEIERALAMGIKDYLVKAEFNPEEVVAKVASALKDKTIKNVSEKEAKKILIIEDDQLLLELSSTKLQKEGFVVEMAIDSEEGLRKALSVNPDLILLDLVLPGMSGFEILKQIKENPDKTISNIPIIILSNLGQDSDIKKASELGASGYLVKASVTIDEIATKIRKTLAI